MTPAALNTRPRGWTASSSDVATKPIKCLVSRAAAAFCCTLRPVPTLLRDISSIMESVAQPKAIHEYFSITTTLIIRRDEGEKQGRKNGKNVNVRQKSIPVWPRCDQTERLFFFFLLIWSKSPPETISHNPPAALGTLADN